MNSKTVRAGLFVTLVVHLNAVLAVAADDPSALYRVPDGVQSRWSSFENPTGEKGAGGKTNKGAKGAAFDSVAAGQTRTLMETKGSGRVGRMWFTVSERDPEMLRSLRLDMYWDGAATPAVSVPFGDFMCAIFGRLTPMENEFFANPEGRSFNCFIPMPFRTGAKITIANESKRNLDKLFYDIDYILTPQPDPDAMYFHAIWRRENPTTLGKDFEILPAVHGKGRFLGAHIGVVSLPQNTGWWGEGEVKMYLDGDAEWPTIAGTGSEDYIGTGWGQGTFQRRYSGSLVADGETKQYGFYRYHVPDPVYFHKDIRVTIQQMGGASKKQVVQLLDKNAPIKPVSIDTDTQGRFVKMLEQPQPVDLKAHDSPDNAWVNMYRQDDVSAVALFYLDKPENGLPPLAAVATRTAGIPEVKPREKN